MHMLTHTQTAYATFVTSHTLVISKDTKPTRSPTQFPRMQPKWSCKQALSLTGRKGTGEKKYQCWRKGGGDGWREVGREGGKTQEVDFYLTHWLSSPLYNVLMQGFLGRCALSGFLRTRMLPLLAQTEKDTMNPLYFLHRGDTHKKSSAIPARLKNVLVASQGIWNNTLQRTILYVTFFKIWD